MEEIILLQLLELLLQHLIRIKTKGYSIRGLCLEIANIHRLGLISGTEKQNLLTFVESNKPKSIYLKKYPTNMYYWEPGVYAPRLRYLRYHIKRLSK